MADSKAVQKVDNWGASKDGKLKDTKLASSKAATEDYKTDSSSEKS
jgi:hypothetical protein